MKKNTLHLIIPLQVTRVHRSRVIDNVSGLQTPRQTTDGLCMDQSTQRPTQLFTPEHSIHISSIHTNSYYRWPLRFLRSRDDGVVKNSFWFLGNLIKWMTIINQLSILSRRSHYEIFKVWSTFCFVFIIMDKARTSGRYLKRGKWIRDERFGSK